MKVLIGVATLVVFLLLTVAMLKRKSPMGRWPYYPKKIMTKPEQVLFYRLLKALPDCIVLSQVQLSRVLGVEKGNNFQQRNNRINRMSLDFVVCAKDASVLAAIELDDRSHGRKNRQVADDKKNKALQDAGVRLIRWKVESMPDETVIRNEVFAVESE